MKHQIEIDLNGVMNKHFQYLIEDKHRVLVVYGGAGSSKSFSICQKYFFESYSKKGMKLLVVRKTARSNRESTFALFKEIISSFNKANHFKINSSDMRITNTITGCDIIFAGLDDVEKLKSVQGISDIWIEEASEIEEADFNQLNIRLRGEGVYKQIVLTFNPIDINHWIKRKLVDVKSEDVLVDHSTYLDNEHLDADYIKLLESYKETDRYWYDVYALGNWGVLSNTLFDKQKISDRIQVIGSPIRTGYFTYDYDGLRISNISFVNDANGYIDFFEDVSNSSYCVGGDTAGEGSDYFIAQVIDAKSGKQVCRLRHQMDADLYTKQVYCLGKYFNDALLSIEANFDTFPNAELNRLGYPNLYVRETEDTFTGSIKKSFGFLTSAVSRPRIISQLVEIVREHTDYFNDKLTLEEMLTFVRNERGRAEAQNGCHDDMVMSIAIAYDSLDQVVFKKERKKTRDYDLDFYNYEG